MALPYGGAYAMMPQAALLGAGLPLSQQAVNPSGPYSPQGRTGAPLTMGTQASPGLKLGSPHQHTQPPRPLQAKVKDAEAKDSNRVHSPSLGSKGAMGSKAIDMSAATKAYQGAPLTPPQGMAFQQGSTPPGSAGSFPRMMTPPTRQAMQPRYAQPPIPFMYQGTVPARMSYAHHGSPNPYLGAPLGGPTTISVSGMNPSHSRAPGLMSASSGGHSSSLTHPQGPHLVAGQYGGLNLGSDGGTPLSSHQSPPLSVSDRSPPNIQFLPTACNVNVKESMGLAVDGGSAGGGLHKPGQTQPQGGEKQNLNESHSLFRNPVLQYELYSYMQQTEGQHVAASYFNSLTTANQTQSHNAGSQEPPSRNSSHAHLPNKVAVPLHQAAAVPSNLSYKRESVTVSVRLDDTPQGTPQASLQGSMSGLSVDMSDMSDLSGRSSIQSEKSRENGSSPASSNVGGGQVQGSGFAAAQPIGSTLMAAQSAQSGPYTLAGLAPREAKGTFFCSDLEQEMCRDHVPSVGQGSGQGSDTDPLSDLEKAGTVEHMMRFLDDSLDERPHQRQSSQTPISMLDFAATDDQVPLPSLSLPPPSSQERPVPLYLRGQASTPTCSSTIITPCSTPQPNLSYAGALRSRPTSTTPQTTPTPPQATPVTPLGSSQLINPFFPPPAGEDGEEQPDPLELLKNLNIKSPHATEALYQYFA